MKHRVAALTQTPPGLGTISVAFQSLATNLVPGCSGDGTQIFVRDRVAGITTCESVGSGGVVGNGASRGATINDDGSVLAFGSVATNLAAPCATGVAQVYVRQRVLGTVTCISVGPDGLPGDGPSGRAALSVRCFCGGVLDDGQPA